MKGASPVFGQSAQRVKPAPVQERDEGRWSLAEGWTAFAALAVMLATVAVAIDDAVWVGHILGTRISQTSFLPAAAVLSVLVGLLLAKTALSTIRAHLIGAAAGAAYLLFAVSAALSDAPSLQERLRDLNMSVSNFAYELFVLQIRSSETSVFLLTLGALLWAAGQFGAFAVFRRHRPLPAILVAAVPLLINVSVTVRDQYLHVIVYFAAALVLLMRLNLVEQVKAWRARAIGDGPTVSAAFLRSGALFITLALLGSTVLAANTSSAPLGRVWRDFDQKLIEFGYEVNRVMGGVTGPARGPNILFAPSQTVREIWESSDAIDLTYISSSSDPRDLRLRGAAYSEFDGRTWHMSERVHEQIAAGSPPMGSSPEGSLSLDGWKQILLEITPVEFTDLSYVSPGRPLQVNVPTEAAVHYDEESGYSGFITGRLPGGPEPGEPISVAAAVPITEGEEQITGAMLAAAGVSYPKWVERYTEVREGSLGPLVYDRMEMLVSQLPPEQRDPYHMAKAVQDWLRRKGGFAYQIDVRGYCVGRNLIDCFLEIKQGFCEYFATTMTMMLRTQSIPARYVTGYLPGKQRADGTWEVPRSAAHAWVEVYFPDYGWIAFDPTPGNTENNNQEPALEPGQPIATPRPPDASPPIPSFDEDFDEGAIPAPQVNPVIPPGGGAGGNALLAVFVIVGLGLTLLLLFAVATFRRMPRTEPELAYRGVARLAARFGHGPRPTQTAYEFADGLGQIVPTVRSELRVVATAKVESTYGGRQLPNDALELLRQAYRRVRIGLLRLIWYRPRRRQKTETD